MKMINDTVGPDAPCKWLKYQRKLVALREHFLAHRGGLVQDTERPADLATHDFADEANDAVHHDVAASVLLATDDVLHEIEAALRRIEGGTYGTCEITGQQIPTARLTAIPWTRYTTEAEAELEKRGKAAGLRVPSTTKRPRSPRQRFH
jgi:RNA polymerase-binding transcription factor DksA